MTRYLPNPGGILAPPQIIGREIAIRSFWDSLERQSLLLVGPRRVGKSCVLQKMYAAPPPGVRMILESVQDCDSIAAFLEHLLTSTARLLRWKGKLSGRSFQALQLLGGSVELGAQDEAGSLSAALSVRGPRWTGVLEAILDDLQTHAVEKNVRLILAWDEFTWFLHRLADAGRGADAGLLLDALRRVRQSPQRYPGIRFVFTGSIGMQEVLDRLQAEGHTQSPLNDVNSQVLFVLDEADARLLASRLTEEAEPELTAALATMSEGHPYVMQHIAAVLRRDGEWSERRAREALAQLLEHSQDPLDLSQFVHRIAQYQGGARAERTRAVLDALVEGPLRARDLQDRLSLEREETLAILDFLRRNLYLTRDEGRYTFSLRLLQRYWAQERDLLDALPGGAP